jgi:hypothetical protein
MAEDEQFITALYMKLQPTAHQAVALRLPSELRQLLVQAQQCGRKAAFRITPGPAAKVCMLLSCRGLLQRFT